MTPHEQKTALRTALLSLFAGIALWFFPSAQANKAGTLLLAIGLSATLLWAGNTHFSRRLRTKATKRRLDQPATPLTEDNVNQAYRILTLQDDGRRHYEKLPPGVRRKSIFGGKMID